MQRSRPRAVAACDLSWPNITARRNSRPTICTPSKGRDADKSRPLPHPSPKRCRPVQFDEHSDRPAGHVFTLPHHRVPSSDVKDRGYVLLHRCAPPAVATLAYRSSKSTERDQFGSPTVVLSESLMSPSARSYERRNVKGAFNHSLIYPTRLVSWPSSDLVRSSQTVTTLLRSIRNTTAIALGMGTGTHRAAGHGHRGKLLRLTDTGTRLFPFRWGVVLTEPRYSAELRWQVVVPLFRSASKPLPYNVRVDNPDGPGSRSADWLTAINPTWTEAVLSCALVCSVSHLDGHVDQIDAATVDDATLVAIERELTSRFLLQ